MELQKSPQSPPIPLISSKLYAIERFEEIEEIKNAETDFELASEIGDLFFALVNVSRWKNVDSESALRATNMKFKKRFAYIERGAKKLGRDLSSLSLDEMESLWQEAKVQGM